MQMVSSHHSLSGKGEHNLECEELLLLTLHGEQLRDDLQLDSRVAVSSCHLHPWFLVHVLLHIIVPSFPFLLPAVIPLTLLTVLLPPVMVA